MNRLTFRSALLGLASLALISACDVVDAPYTETPIGPVDTASVKQNVMIEDYTGHTCGNCPAAADIAKQIQTAYGPERVIVVAVHAGPFADPQPPDYPMDMRTPDGDALDKTFRVSRVGNPNGMVNRVTRNGKLIIGKDDWSTVTSDLLKQKPLVDLSMTHTYDTTTRTITATITVKYLQAGTTDYNLVTLLTESEIEGDQTDYRKDPSHIHDYVFEHVLRVAMNGVWGEPLSTAEVAAGTTIKKTITYTIPSDRTWDPKHCHLVAYVHRYNTTKDVLQVVSKDLQ